MMKNTSATILFLSQILMAGLATVPSAKSIHTNSPRNIGIVHDGETLAVEFEVSNETLKSITLRPNGVSCGCVIADQSKTVKVPPQSTANITIQIDTTDKDGKFSYSANYKIIELNEMLEFVIEGKVEPLLRTNPPSIRLRVTRESPESVEATVAIQAQSNEIAANVAIQKDFVPPNGVSLTWNISTGENTADAIIKVQASSLTDLGEYMVQLPLVISNSPKYEHYKKMLPIHLRSETERLKQTAVYFGVVRANQDKVYDANLETSGGARLVGIGKLPDFIRIGKIEPNSIKLELHSAAIDKKLPPGATVHWVEVQFDESESLKLPIRFYLVK